MRRNDAYNHTVAKPMDRVAVSTLAEGTLRIARESLAAELRLSTAPLKCSQGIKARCGFAGSRVVDMQHAWIPAECRFIDVTGCVRTAECLVP